ncbi:putative ferric-chelate reductase (NADH) [Helianthus anomalus]
MRLTTIFLLLRSRWQSKLSSVALRFGLIGNLCLAFLFFPVTRGSSIWSLFGLTSKASIKYHIWLGHIVMTLFTSHGVCYIIYWIVTKQTSEVPYIVTNFIMIHFYIF